MSVSTSASFEHTRRDAGFLPLLQRYVREELPKFTKRPEWVSDIGKVLHNGLALPYQKAVASAVLRAAGSASPRAIAVGIPERGWKVRMITKSDDNLTIALTPIANCLRSILRSMRDTRGQVKDDAEYLRDIVSFLNTRSIGHQIGDQPREFICKSTDLKSSTDFIPRDVALATIEGFIDGLSGKMEESYHETFASVLRMAVGDWDITTPLGTFRSSRGVLMGTPISFIILNTIHSFCFQGLRLRLSRVKGDDGLAIGRREEIVRYTSRVSSLIAPINRLKDYESIYGFVFLERLALLKEGKFILAESQPMRMLMTFEGQSLPWYVPFDLSRGAYRRMSRAVNTTRGDLLKLCLRKGVFPYLPRMLGGCGLLNPGMRYNPLKTVPRWVRQFLYWLLYKSEPLDAVRILQEISWSTSKSRDRIDFKLMEEKFETYLKSGLSTLEDLQDEEEDITEFNRYSPMKYGATVLGGLLTHHLIFKGIKPQSPLPPPVSRFYRIFTEQDLGGVPLLQDLRSGMAHFLWRLRQDELYSPKVIPKGSGLTVNLRLTAIFGHNE
jgi:hypothetical protein